MARSASVLLVLLALAGGLTACGASKDTAGAGAYVTRVNAAQDRFQRSAQAIQAQISTATSTPAQDRRALDAFAAAVRRTVAELRAITPPARVAALHARLVAALAAYGPVIAARRASAGSADGRALITARTRFSTASDAVTSRIQAAIARINAQLAR